MNSASERVIILRDSDSNVTRDNFSWQFPRFVTRASRSTTCNACRGNELALLLSPFLPPLSLFLCRARPRLVRLTNVFSRCKSTELNGSRFCSATHGAIPPRWKRRGSRVNIARSRSRTIGHLIPLVRQHPKRTLDPLNFRKRTVLAAKFIEMSPSASARERERARSRSS